MERSDANIPEIVRDSPLHFLCQLPEEGLGCENEGSILPKDYNGTINYTRSGRKCVNWSQAGMGKVLKLCLCC